MFLFDVQAETSSLNDASVEAVVDGGEEEEKKKRYPWEGSERDYLYDEVNIYHLITFVVKHS